MVLSEDNQNEKMKYLYCGSSLNFSSPLSFLSYSYRRQYVGITDRLKNILAMAENVLSEFRQSK